MKELRKYIQGLLSEQDSIDEHRKAQLIKISYHIRQKKEQNEKVRLTFICTHNSRRSHMAQIWAQAAADHFKISGVECYSGGTMATSFYPSAVRALQKAGFHIERGSGEMNPEYTVTYSAEKDPIIAFSKEFSDQPNPRERFAAVMVCSDADEACPFVPGAEARFSIPYEDPKKADGTPGEEEVYDERCREVGREMLFVFANV